MGFTHQQVKFPFDGSKTTGKSHPVPIPTIVFDHHSSDESEHSNGAGQSSTHNHVLCPDRTPYFSPHSKPSSILKRALSEISMDSSDDLETLKRKTEQPLSQTNELSKQKSISHSFSKCALPPGRPLQAAPKLVSAHCGSILSDQKTPAKKQMKPSLKWKYGLQSSRRLPFLKSGSIFKEQRCNIVATGVLIANNGLTIQ